jgi:hypothetical protein
MADSLEMAEEPLETAGFRLALGVPTATEAALLAAIAGIRELSPLAPIDLVVEGVLQRPYLQRLIAETSPGLLKPRLDGSRTRTSPGGNRVSRFGATAAAHGRRPGAHKPRRG